MSARRAVASLLTSAGVALAVRALPEPPLPGWRRTNFRGREVSLSGGLSAACGALAGSAVSASPLRLPSIVAATSALLAGAYDDLLGPRAEHASDKGIAGHLGALRSGRVSGGAVKVAVIGTGAVLAASRLPNTSGNHRGVRMLVDASLIAGSANLLNLFDLRPGRAAKVVVAISGTWTVLGSLSGPAAAVLGAGSAVLADDLAEKTMLGDLGANTLGALIGVHLSARSNTSRRIALVVVAALTIASERVSFSKVIENVPALRRLDNLGRVPPIPPARPRT